MLELLAWHPFIVISRAIVKGLTEMVTELHASRISATDHWKKIKDKSLGRSIHP